MFSMNGHLKLLTLGNKGEIARVNKVVTISTYQGGIWYNANR